LSAAVRLYRVVSRVCGWKRETCDKRRGGLAAGTSSAVFMALEGVLLVVALIITYQG